MAAQVQVGVVHAVAPQETALLVLRYLQENAFLAAATAFAQEAASLLRLIAAPKPHQQVKGLHAVLNEYVALDARARSEGRARAAADRAAAALVG